MLQRIHEPSAEQFNAARFAHQDHLAAISDHNGIALLWRPDIGRSWALRGHAGEVRSVEISPNDFFILTSGADATAKLWDAENGELLDTIAEHGSQMPEVPFQAAGFSPDGNWVLTGSTDGVIRLWGLHLEQRSPQQIEAHLRCRVPWRLNEENLVPASPDDTACQLN